MLESWRIGVGTVYLFCVRKNHTERLRLLKDREVGRGEEEGRMER